MHGLEPSIACHVCMYYYCIFFPERIRLNAYSVQSVYACTAQTKLNANRLVARCNQNDGCVVQQQQQQQLVRVLR